MSCIEPERLSGLSVLCGIYLGKKKSFRFQLLSLFRKDFDFQKIVSFSLSVFCNSYAFARIDLMSASIASQRLAAAFLAASRSPPATGVTEFT